MSNSDLQHLYESGADGDIEMNGNSITNELLHNFTAATEKTISSGAITADQTLHTVDTESDISSDDLATINGGSNGDLLYLRATNGSRTVVLKHGTGNIVTPDGKDYSLDNTDKIVCLIYTANNNWQLVGSSGGGGSPREITASSPLVVLGDTETLALWRGTAPAGATLSINSGSISDDTGSVPSGVEIKLNNITDTAQTTLITSTYTETPSNNDIVVGGDDIIIEIYNDSGATQNLSGNVNARLD